MNKKVFIIISIIFIIIFCIGLIFCFNKNNLIEIGNLNVNTPQLVEGMKPVKWNGSEWVETTVNDKEWYNYDKKQWANVKLADGSMFVWIPRYAYKITDGYHQNSKNGGTIEIEFLSGITNSQKDYIVHPAFKFGDEELQGIWVAKYEASKTDATSTNVGKSETISFKKNTLSTTDYDLNQILYYCRKMESQNIYGWNNQNGTLLNTGDIIDDNNNFDTHLIKNVEWGAVSYLAQSKYGINKKISTNTSQISGNGGLSSTTTGNETGIYDMAGQNSEYVSAYFYSTTSNYTLEKYTNMVKFDEKYKDKYTAYSSDKVGEAIYETSSKSALKNGWYSSETTFINSSNPFFVRGGKLDNGNIYNFSAFSGGKGYYGFRATIVISTDVLSDEENQSKKEIIEKENLQNVRSNILNNLINTLDINYTKGYIETMDTFTNTFKASDVDFTKIRNYYNAFKTDYETIKNNISQYDELQNEMKDILSITDEFFYEFDKATTQTNDVNTIINYWESSSDKWQQSYKSVYKALYGKDLE
ncbi:MAG: hypothetical protein J6A89_04425 [Clostridia bacterium]|nr:hypothetical protein [Clostridia bacterium]